MICPDCKRKFNENTCDLETIEGTAENPIKTFPICPHCSKEDNNREYRLLYSHACGYKD